MRPLRRRRSTTAGGAFERDPAELDPVREHEHVRRKAVPAEVRRLPELLGRDVRAPARRRAGSAEPGAAGIATAVGADEKDRALRRVRRPRDRRPRSCVECVQLLPGKRFRPPRRPSPGRASRRRRRSGRRTSSDLARERLQGRPNRRRAARVSSDSVPAPGAADLDQQPVTPWVAVPGKRLAGGKRRCRSRWPTWLTPAAGRRAADRAQGRSRARPRTRGTRRSAFAVSRPGRGDGAQQDVLRRVLELDELEHLDVVAHGAEQLRPRGVRHLRGEPLPQRAVTEKRAERRVLELRQQLVLTAGNRQDHRCRRHATARSSASSVAVSQACRLTTRSTPPSCS